MASPPDFRWCSSDGAPIEQVLERPLLDKLGGEIERYQDKDFLKAAMAVCALTIMSDDEVRIQERCRINDAIRDEPAFRIFDVEKAGQILDDYIAGLAKDKARAKQILYAKVHRMADDHKLSRTLMRVAYLIITADYNVDDREIAEFRHLCNLLHLEPDEVWRDASIWSGGQG